MQYIVDDLYVLTWVTEQGWLLSPNDPQHIPYFADTLAAQRLPYLVNITTCFANILLEFDKTYSPLHVPHYCKQIIKAPRAIENNKPLITHSLPIDFTAGLDIDELASQCSISVTQFQEAILELELNVMVNGFAPGFSYCGELPKSLQVPRRKNPRVHIPAGSVAIADKYLAIYPQVSPGGWHIIGHCRQSLFDINAAVPSTLNLGDMVTFYPEGLI